VDAGPQEEVCLRLRPVDEEVDQEHDRGSVGGADQCDHAERRDSPAEAKSRGARTRRLQEALLGDAGLTTLSSEARAVPFVVLARPEGSEHTPPTIAIEGVDALVDVLLAA